MASECENVLSELSDCKGPRIGIRHIQVCLLFLMTAVAYGTRICLSVAIIAMTDKTISSNSDIPTYNWKNKSVILSSFYWGYIVLQVVAGELCRKYGTKSFLTGTMFVNSLACILTPAVAANIGSYGVMTCRVIQGLSQGFFYPAVYDLLGQWAPVSERSLLATIATSGSIFGTIVSMPLTGLISSSSLGWPAIFYFFGIMGFLWIILWSLLGGSKPTDHYLISDQERDYIQNSLMIRNSTPKKAKTPWKDILTSMPVWAISVCHIGQSWGYTTLLTELPNYMSNVMKFNIKSNGLLSAMPFLAAFVLSFPLSHLSDHLMNKHYMSRGKVRKLFTTIASAAPATALIIVGFLPDNYSVFTVIMLIFIVGINAAAYGGYQVSHPDLSPKFSGTILGIGNAMGCISSILAPLYVQLIITHDSNKLEWRIVFISSAFMYLVSNLFYIVFASGEVQKWNDNEQDSETQPIASGDKPEYSGEHI